MARKTEPSQSIGPDWFLVEWMQSTKMTQAELSRRTGWPKATANEIYHGKTSYYRQILNEAASALNVQPYELLMPPEEAYHVRRLRTVVEEEHRLRAVADQRAQFKPEEPPAERLVPRRSA
jgi:transcriptional regulator with XRE-family HTH domain